jgi:hypothetical protein
MAAPGQLEAEIASTVEALFGAQPDRMGRMIALLAQCRTSQAARIFNCLPDAAPTPAPNGAAEPAKHGPTWCWTH